MQIQAAGVAWFYEDDYEAFKSVLPDRRWHATYAEWLKSAQDLCEKFDRQGTIPIQAYARSNDFVAWCGQTGRNVNTHALTAFANELAARTLSGNQTH